MSWWHRLVASGRSQRPEAVSHRVPEEVTALVSAGRAAGLQPTLKSLAAGNCNFRYSDLAELAIASGWDAIELEKLAAFWEFASGNAASAYRRVMAGALARTDYAMFTAACLECYVHDRFDEGYELVRQFEPDETQPEQLVGYLALAGYLTYVVGGSLADSTAYFDRALDRRLASPMLLVNAYQIYFQAGRFDRVAELRRVIQERYGEDADAQYALACVELARDYYPEGFRLAEARYRMPEINRVVNAGLLDKPRWQGGELTGKRLLVHGEQGYGDTIMMARYLPLLRSLGAAVTLDCRAPAAPLLRHNFPDCEIVAGDPGTPVDTPFDYWVGAMSLPHHFSTTAGNVPAREGYLTVPDEQAAYWRQRVAELAPRARPRIGLAWSGNPSHRYERWRSLPFDRLVEHLRARPDCDFFALQTSVPMGAPGNLISVPDELITFADTAALIAQMDLVITVDTSVVHLAGALGKRTWLLLPRRYEWRWGLEGEQNSWYESVRVLRQDRDGDWDGLVTMVFSRLAAEVVRAG